jgi:HD-GYP domain-containing protein (c-di-GMP phosphodiesterase class II)
MEQHTKIGESLLAHVPLLHGEGLGVVRSHHERWDGTGYPDRLAETDIPLGARIFAVADALDAMTNDRAYRGRMSWDDAFNELRRGAGSHFDPSVIDALQVCEPDLFATHSSVLAASAS